MWAWFLLACAFEPLYGAWDYAQTTVEVDTCGLEPRMESRTARIDLQRLEAGGLRITDAEGFSFDCTLEDMAFNCPDRWPDTIPLGDTTLESEGEAHGAFDTDAVARGSQSATLDCMDLSCEAGAALLGMDPPCDLQVSFVLTKVAE